jgi:septal ring factor EnvC (AmiA/AmiB activator)
MIKTAMKSAGNVAKQAAVQTAKQIAGELIEIPKQAVSEAAGLKPAGSEMKSKGPASSVQKEDAVPAEDYSKATQVRLDYLERELEKLKLAREEERRAKEARVMEEQRRDEEKKRKKISEIITPPKRKIGLPGIFKRPKGTGEWLKGGR